MRHGCSVVRRWRVDLVAFTLALVTMKREIRFTERYVVVWSAFLATRFLWEFLPGGTPRWTQKPQQARIYADKAAAEKAATSARSRMKRQGIAATITVEPRTLLD